MDLGTAGVTAPRALLWLGTGISTMPERLTHAKSFTLERWKSWPGVWRAATLWTGELERCPVWLLEDPLGDPRARAYDAGWESEFPCWVAARAGARVLLHSSAGLALPRESETPLVEGSVTVLRDHVNLSGASPLQGLGGSQLGPLFPDVTRLHHVGLRRAALARAERLGLRAQEVVAACTLGPSLDTPAERRAWARLGAEISVQGLAAPLLSAAHAGLSVLALTAITQAGSDPADLGRILAATQSATAALEDWISALGSDLAAAAVALAAEQEGA
jgi:hypothetical protein